MLKNTESEWGAVAKAFHWLTAFLILGQLVLGLVATQARISPLKIDLFVWHKSIGLLILLLVMLRVAWRLGHPPPAPPADIAAWERHSARLSHGLLYLFMAIVPLTGWWVSDTSRIPFRLFWTIPVPDFLPPDRDLSELAAGVHGALVALLVGVVVVHVLAALRHHFRLGNDVLVRMLPFRTKRRC